jgi:hypothetical protein
MPPPGFPSPELLRGINQVGRFAACAEDHCDVVGGGLEPELLDEDARRRMRIVDKLPAEQLPRIR